ncbi:hypothetical protein POTOM_032143 [Populus tomentosa]|uniref:GT-1/4-like C-terminal domain-containing protein n=1 Tax=Populus tomentosa TaxID=118781 RepID=A0A8X8CSJ0_POPTO|nr:hypothetical protein POTOM_032143 [Populus tomentosa]
MIGTRRDQGLAFNVRNWKSQVFMSDVMTGACGPVSFEDTSISFGPVEAMKVIVILLVVKQIIVLLVLNQSFEKCILHGLDILLIFCSNQLLDLKSQYSLSIRNQSHFICDPALYQHNTTRASQNWHQEASARPTLNLERRLDHDGHPLAITAADAVAASGVPPWNWRETPGNGAESQSYGGRVISVKSGDYTRRIGIDGTTDAIREAIKSAFRLRTKRAFWLEDEDQIIRALDRDMPLGNYTLHLDEGLAIKVCLYDQSDHMPVHTEEKIFYTEDDYRDFLSHRGWTCLREFDGYRNIDSMDDLRHDAIYRGVS